jgi:hypothetical protein
MGRGENRQAQYVSFRRPLPIEFCTALPLLETDANLVSLCHACTRRYRIMTCSDPPADSSRSCRRCFFLVPGHKLLADTAVFSTPIHFCPFVCGSRRDMSAMAMQCRHFVFVLSKSRRRRTFLHASSASSVCFICCTGHVVAYC